MSTSSQPALFSAAITTVPLAPVPDGWLRVGTVGRLWLGAIALALAAVVLFATVLGNIGNAEVEHPERTLIAACVMAAFAFVSWSFATVRRHSRKAPRLANAVDFTDASVAPTDSWVHFSAFRAARWPTLVSVTIIGLAAVTLAVVFAIFPPKFAPEPQWVVQIIVWVAALVCAAFGYFFLYGALATFRTQRANGGWPVRYGVTLGESGIALRLATINREVAWDDITEISPQFFNAQDRKNQTPVIKLIWVTTDSSARRKATPLNIAISNFDVAPHMLYTALDFYWRNPDARTELGTTTGQRRLEAWAKAAR